MQFETSANPFIRPGVGPSPQPAFAVAPSDRQGDGRGAVREAANGTGVAQLQASELPPGDPAAESLGFEDLLDVVNPLQHIPLVSNLYREVTGDEIAAPARILGGFLYGGPIGFVASAVNAIAEEATGRDLGEAALALVFGEEAAPEVATATASATQTAALDEADAATAPIILGALPTPKASGFRAPPPPDLAEAPAPGGNDDRLLTGEAALEALAADLGARSAAAAEPAPAAAVPSALAAPPAEASGGVPANLIGIGSRDRRGLGPLQARARMPMPTDRLPNQLPGAASAPSGHALIGSPLPAAGGAAMPEGNADFSVQLLDALKKYESMMQQRKTGA